MYSPKCICKIAIFLFLVCPYFARASDIAPLVKYLVEVAESHRAENSKPAPIIAIGGCPGVGKTYLTQTLARSLYEKDVRCRILLFDDFILSAEERKKIGSLWDLRHFKGIELHAFLTSVLSGKAEIQKPIRDPLTGETDIETCDLNEIDVILFDGLYTLCTEPPLSFYNYCHSGIYVEANESDIFNWRWGREIIKASPRTPEQFKSIMDVYFNDFHQNIQYSKENATFIVKKDSEHNYNLEHQLD